MTKGHGPAPYWLPKRNITSVSKFKTGPSTSSSFSKKTAAQPSSGRSSSAFCRPVSSFNLYHALTSAFRHPLPNKRCQLVKLPTPPLRIWCDIKSFCTSTTMAIQGHHGVGTWTQKPDYKAYKSPYGPNGITAGSFGIVGATFLLFFFSDVPKVRTDIMQKLPIIGDHFIKEIPPEDNRNNKQYPLPLQPNHNPKSNLQEIRPPIPLSSSSGSSGPTIQVPI
ncbi:MAG: hypothetical protein L6R37_000853 [Teloschistes peruensis]|nr:MAG: hypothetical protein L6R37_000853 [Teloschistes peruensis]